MLFFILVTNTTIKEISCIIKSNLSNLNAMKIGIKMGQLLPMKSKKLLKVPHWGSYQSEEDAHNHAMQYLLMNSLKFPQSLFIGKRIPFYSYFYDICTSVLPSSKQLRFHVIKKHLWSQNNLPYKTNLNCITSFGSIFKFIL